MPYYRLYCINAAGGFFHCEDFNADNDALAIEEAARLRGEHAAELWQQARMVHSFTQEQAQNLA